MYQRGGKARADAGKLKAELITGVAVGSSHNPGKRLVPDEPAPPISADLQMRRPSATVDAYNAEESEADKKEQTKKQLASITGRMFEVLNNYEDDEDTYDEIPTLERRRLSHPTSTQSRKMMRSHIDGMMANYDQISAEREELLESLAEWFQESHNNADTLSDLSYNSRGRSTAIPDRFQMNKEKPLPQELQMIDRERLEGDVAPTLTNDDEESLDSATRDAVTMSWKYAAMEIYGLLSDVRDTDAVEMNVLEKRVMELVASLAEQSKIIDRLSGELRHQKELVRFSDKTTQGLAADNTELREKLDKMRGRLAEARNNSAATGTTEKDGELSSVKGGGESEKEKEKVEVKNDSDDSDKLEVCRAQIKDLKKRLAQQQEENKKLQHRLQSPDKISTEGVQEEASKTLHCSSEVTIEATSTPHEDDHSTTTLQPVSSSSIAQSQSSSHKQNTETVTTNTTNNTHEMELVALREQLQCVLAEKAALEVECQKKKKKIVVGNKPNARGNTKKEVARTHQVQSRSQHTQTSGNTNTQPFSHQPITKTIPETANNTPTTPSNITTPKAEPVKSSNITTTTVSDEPTPTVVDSNKSVTVPSIAIETVDTATNATRTVEPKKGTLEILDDVMNDIIANQSDLVTADSTTLHRIHSDLQQVCDVIFSCLVQSSMVAMGTENVNASDDVINPNVASNPRNDRFNNGPQPVHDAPRQSHHSTTRSRDTGRMKGEVEEGEVSERRPQPTRDEMKMFIGQAMQSIQTGERGLLSGENRDKLQTMFEALQQRHRQREEMGTVAYPLPARFLTHSGGHVISHVTDHHPQSDEIAEQQQPDLKHSVSVKAMASGHSINHNKKVSSNQHSYKDSQEAQINEMLHPWGNPFHSHKYHSNLHTSTAHNLMSSILTSSSHSPTMTAITGLGTTTTMRATGGGGGGREGKKRKKKRQTRYAQVIHSNFLQVGNTTPPRTAPPAGPLKGVANSLGNHHYGNQTTTNAVSNRSEVQPSNDAGATFIDLLLQSPRVSNRNRSGGNSNRGNQTGSSTLKLPHI